MHCECGAFATVFGMVRVWISTIRGTAPRQKTYLQNCSNVAAVFLQNARVVLTGMCTALVLRTRARCRPHCNDAALQRRSRSRASWRSHGACNGDFRMFRGVFRASLGSVWRSRYDGFAPPHFWTNSRIVNFGLSVPFLEALARMCNGNFRMFQGVF